MNRKNIVKIACAVLATAALAAASWALPGALLRANNKPAPGPEARELAAYLARTQGTDLSSVVADEELHAMQLTTHEGVDNPWAPTPPAAAAGASDAARAAPPLAPDRLPRHDYFGLLSDMAAGRVVAVGMLQVKGYRDLMLYVTETTGRFAMAPSTLPQGSPLAAIAPSLWDALERHRIPFVTLEPAAERVAAGAATLGFLGTHFAEILSLLLTLLLLGVIFRSLGATSSKFGAERERPALRFDDVIGAAEAKDALREVQEFLADPGRFKTVGASIPRGVLMTGDPGTGKTMLAKALAGECGAEFISINGGSFSAMFMGAAVGRVKKVFALARKCAPCILFIDEFDGLGKRSTGGDGDAATAENNRVINQILVELDGFTASDGVVLICATNHERNIDPALLRPGRMDRLCRISLPNLDEREALFKQYLGRFPLLDAVDCRRYARFAAGMSPSAIATVCNQAALRSVRRDANGICAHDIDVALDANRMGGLTPHIGLDEKNRRCVAYHEAGHALLAKLLHLGSVDKVSIAPRSGGSLGVTLVTTDEDVVLQRQSELLGRLEMLLAGRCAEELFCGEVTTGAASDLQEASRLAMAMVSNYGFGRNGLFSLAAFGEHPPESALREAVTDARQLLEDANARCTARLGEHRQAMDRVAAELFENETILGDVVDRAIAGRGALDDPAGGADLGDRRLLTAA
jgi:cell division protease FtsH